MDIVRAHQPIKGHSVRGSAQRAALLLVIALGLFALPAACDGDEEPTITPPPTMTATPAPTSTAIPTPTPIPAPTQMAIPMSVDRPVLEALYLSTKGDNWKRNDNWLTDAPLGEWYGVTADETGRVVEVDIGDNWLVGSLPPEMGSLTNLRKLLLSHNYLGGEIPPELGQLSNLTHMYLRFTHLSGEIPGEFTNLENLQELILSQNLLSGDIPMELTELTG